MMSVTNQYIGDLIERGFTSGYYPGWNLLVTGYQNMTEGDLKYIAGLVRKGFTSGYDPVYWEIEIHEIAEEDLVCAR